MGSSRAGRAPMGSRARSTGTNTSSTRKWWLPVPLRPETCQVSSMVTSLGENTAMRIRGPSGSVPVAVSMQLP